MSLRDAIKDLRNVAKTLDKANFNFEMNAPEKFLDGIKVDKPAKPPEDVLKKLLEKYLRGEELNSKDRRTLPFIIYEPPITRNGTIKISAQKHFGRSNLVTRKGTERILYRRIDAE